MPRKSDTASDTSADPKVDQPEVAADEQPTVDNGEAETVETNMSIFSEDDMTANDIRIVERYSMYAACGGLLPLPVLDFGILFTVQVKMILDLADEHGVRVDKKRAKMVLAAIVGGAVPQLAREGTAMGLASAAKVIPGIGTGVGMVVASSVAYIETRLIGRVFANHFRDGRAIVDIDTGAVKEWFNKSKEKLIRKKREDDLVVDEAPAAAEA